MRFASTTDLMACCQTAEAGAGTKYFRNSSNPPLDALSGIIHSPRRFPSSLFAMRPLEGKSFGNFGKREMQWCLKLEYLAAASPFASSIKPSVLVVESLIDAVI